MCLSCRVAKVVAPKKAALQQAEAEYGTLMEGLAAKKAELGAVVAALNALNDKLAAMQVRVAGTSSSMRWGGVAAMLPCVAECSRACRNG
jgi:hypothetical protein